MKLYPKTREEAKRRRKHVYIIMFFISMLMGYAMHILIYHNADLVTASIVEQLDSKAQWVVEYRQGIAKNEIR